MRQKSSSSRSTTPPKQLGRARWLVLALVVAACSSAPSDALAGADSIAVPESSVAAPAESESEPSEPDSPTTSSDQDPDGASEPSEPVDPLRSAGDAQPEIVVGDNGAWISRRSLAASSIEVTWSNGESDDDVDFTIHRLVQTDVQPPEASDLTTDNLIHSADDVGNFVDDGVDEGTRYWYGLRVLTPNGDLTGFAWHEAVAVDDTEPPSVIAELTAVTEGDNVLVSWSEPSENFELHSYRVLRGIDGAEPETVATTFDVEQRSFLDDTAPESGEVVYQVDSLDFHWNRSEIAQVVIDLS